MFSIRLRSRKGLLIALVAAIPVAGGLGLENAWAGDFTITLPKRSHLTPVQRLNREGVALMEKHQYEKAEEIFYKAYLYDPGDPFTLNNLGYTAELQGQLDRALKFYALAAEQGSDALIDRSSAKQLEGKPVSYALSNLKDLPMRVNRMNVQAIELLVQGRYFEAAILLRQALLLDPKNPFTLNNIGVADQDEGDYQNALKYYHEAADSRSSEPIVVTSEERSRGKPVSEVAAESARQLEERIRQGNTAEERATMLTLRGVSAANRNDWPSARQDFLQAYSLDGNSAFSLNNLGYVAEKDGDLETAEYFYGKARSADDAKARIGLATEPAVQGMDLSAVATDNNRKVDSALERYSQGRRQQTGPVELTPRYGGPAGNSVGAPGQPPSSAVPPAQAPSTPQVPR